MLAVALSVSCSASTSGGYDWPETIIPDGQSTITVQLPCNIGVGTVSRTCLFSRNRASWGPISTQCECAPDDIWTSISLGYPLTLSCRGTVTGENSDANRLCQTDGVWGQIMNSANCKCAGIGDVFDDTISNTIVSQECDAGSLDNYCNAVGVWGETTNNDCHCVAVDDWMDADYDTVAILTCGSGAITRSCSSKGHWDEADSTTCGCAAENGYDFVVIESTATARCDLGSRTRSCDAPRGTWGEENLSNCFCRENSINGESWPQTGAGSLSATKQCQQGTRSRTCNTQGYWEDVNYDGCACPADPEGDWPETEPGVTVSITCANGFNRTRTCNAQGFWDEPNTNQCNIYYYYNIIQLLLIICIYIVCPQDFITPATPSNSIVQVNCPSGYYTRTCSANGEWVGEIDFSQCYCVDDTNVWPNTLVGSESFINCGVGKKTRQCGLYGLWDDTINYDECFCRADVRYPQTPANQIASVSCPYDDGTHLSTRKCDAKGEWEVEDNSQCPVRNCPAESNWPESTAGAIATLGCENDGYMSRTCNSDGTWSTISYLNCACLAPTTHEPITIGDTYTVPCGEGNIQYTCSPLNGHLSEGDLSTCKCIAEGYWESIKAGTSTSLQCEGSGMVTRQCGFDGYWNDADTSSCKCPQDSLWGEVEANQIATIACDSGSMTRTCNEYGKWNTAVNNNCMCANENNQYFALNYNDIHYCDIGNKIRTCTNGKFTSWDATTCQCKKDDIWGVTSSDNTVSIQCSNGGHLIRTCTQEGQWSDVTSNNCMCTGIYDGICYTSAYGESTTFTCGTGYMGDQTITCTQNGYTTPDRSQCMPMCLTPDNTYIAIGEQYIISCNIGEYGQKYRTCMYDDKTMTSTLGEIVNECQRIMCPEDGLWQPVTSGNTQTLSCELGYSGSYTRYCNYDGTWGNIESTCTQLYCEATNEYPRTPAGSDASITCMEGYSGYRTKHCSYNGEWEDSSEVIMCTRNRCPAEGTEWPETDSLTSVTGSCPTDIGYTGSYERHCLADGTWEALSDGIYSTCTPLPLNLNIYPSSGDLTVSRHPSIRIYPNYMPFNINLLPNCVPKIYNNDESYDLKISSLQYTNAIVLDMSSDSYLNYAEYTVSIPPCWKSSNGANLPYNTVEYTIHTSMITPSAVESITINEHPNDGTFIVSFTPSINISGSPIVEYVLAFDPPVYTPISIDGSKTSFDPILIPSISSVNVIIVARNSMGYSPSTITTYTISTSYYVPKETVSINVNTYISKNTNEMTINLALHINQYIPSIYYTLFNIQCTNTQNINIPTISLNDFTNTNYIYTMDIQNVDTQISCSIINTLNNKQGPSTTYDIRSIVFPDNAIYSKVTDITYSLINTNSILLSWNIPSQLYTTLPITSYKISISIFGSNEEPIIYTTTGLSFILSNLSTNTYTIQICAMNDNNEGEKELISIPINNDTELNYEKEGFVVSLIKDTFIKYTFNTEKPLDGSCNLKGSNLIYLINIDKTQSLIYNENNKNMYILFDGLVPNTRYTLTCEFNTISNKYSQSIDTLSINDDIHITISMDTQVTNVYSTSLNIVSTLPGEIYCESIKSMNTFSFESFMSIIKSGSYNDYYKTINDHENYKYPVYDLESDTQYYFYCVIRQSNILTKDYTYTFSSKSDDYVTTHYHADYLQVISISPLPNTIISRQPKFTFTFNSYIDIDIHNINNNLLLSCGGKTIEIPVNTASISKDMLSITISVNELLPENTQCQISFNNYGAVKGINKIYLPSEVYNGLFNKNQFNINSIESETILYTVTSDVIVGSITINQSILSPVETKQNFLSFTEDVVISEGEYTIQCGQYLSTFTTQDNMNIKYINNQYILEIVTGLLPSSEACLFIINSNIFKDLSGNIFKYNINVISEYEIPFSTNDDTITINLLSMNPISGSLSVTPRSQFTLYFDRTPSVVSTKTVTIECLSCENNMKYTIVPTCSTKTKSCSFKPTTPLLTNNNYKVIFDNTTFKHAYGNEFVQYTNDLVFTTSNTDCSLDYIMNEWNDFCTCTNTGSHCQCTCGSVAVLRQF
ncbi:hypothetical protein WA158_004385 [Blastocystis sp. Blastoise]